MKKVTLIFMLLPMAAHPQAVDSDSLVALPLQEVNVVASRQYTDATKTVYIPDKSQREASSDGISLLLALGIPQLSVNPISETVKTADNNKVDLFVNYRPASDEEISNLNPADVRRVEYLNFPTDPRFQRAQHVVNFVVREYRFGGYAKFTGKERFFVNSGECGGYSKYAYKNVVWDIMVNAEYDDNTHNGANTVENYIFDTTTVKRISSSRWSTHSEYGLYGALRGVWNRGEKISVSNTLSCRRSRVPENFYTGDVTLSGLYPLVSNFADSSAVSNSAVKWESEFYADFGKGWTFSGDALLELRSNNTIEKYVTSESLIYNRAEEKGWYLKENAQINKELTRKITLFGSITTALMHDDILYTGSSQATNRFNEVFVGCYGGCNVNFRNIAGSVDAGFAVESNSINSMRINDGYPFTHINLQYAANQNNSLNLWMQYATLSPDASMKNPNMLRQNELMYICGNPELKSSRLMSSNISYLWLYGNRFKMAAYCTLFRISNRQIAVYQPNYAGTFMLKKYSNDGDYNHGQVGLKLTYNFFNGKLTSSVAGRCLLYLTTGTNRVTHHPVVGSVNINYYLGKLVLNGFWESSVSYLDGEDGYLKSIPSTYSVGAGWAHKGWNVQLSLANVFKSSWNCSRERFANARYENSIVRFGPEYHRRISLTVSYTLNYGKRIEDNNELQGDSKIETSILH